MECFRVTWLRNNKKKDNEMDSFFRSEQIHGFIEQSNLRNSTVMGYKFIYSQTESNNINHHYHYHHHLHQRFSHLIIDLVFGENFPKKNYPIPILLPMWLFFWENFFRIL